MEEDHRLIFAVSTHPGAPGTARDNDPSARHGPPAAGRPCT
jgi:hypothetical protein